MRNDNPPCFYEIIAFYECPKCREQIQETQDSRNIEYVLYEKCETCNFDGGLKLLGIEK
jgi:predicted RNA-binding Zn-ribbon protein involved in translation (DUF1610 family)